MLSGKKQPDVDINIIALGKRLYKLLFTSVKQKHAGAAIF